MQHAVETGANVQLLALLTLQQHQRAGLIDLGLLDREARGDRLLIGGELLGGDRVSHAKLLRIDLRLFENEIGHELAFGQCLVHLHQHVGLVVFRFDARGCCLLLQIVVLQLHAQIFERGLRGLHLELGFLQFLLELRIAQLEDHALAIYCGAWTQDDPLDARLRRRGDPADVFGDERADASDLAHERAALDLIDPHLRSLDCGRRRLEARQTEREQQGRSNGGGHVDPAANPPRPNVGRRAGNVHGPVLLAGGAWSVSSTHSRRAERATRELEELPCV